MQNVSLKVHQFPNVVSGVEILSHDKFSLKVISENLRPILDGYPSEICIYIFSEDNINQLMCAFNDLFKGGPSIILVKPKFKNVFSSALLNVTTDVFSLNSPMDMIINCIENSLKSNKMRNPKDNDTQIFHMMSILYNLSDRESDCLSMILKGFSHDEISKELNITAKAVSSCKLSAMSKIGLNSLVEVHAFLNMYSMLVHRQSNYLFNNAR